MAVWLSVLEVPSDVVVVIAARVGPSAWDSSRCCARDQRGTGCRRRRSSSSSSSSRRRRTRSRRSSRRVPIGAPVEQIEAIRASAHLCSIAVASHITPSAPIWRGSTSVAKLVVAVAFAGVLDASVDVAGRFAACLACFVAHGTGAADDDAIDGEGSRAHGIGVAAEIQPSWEAGCLSYL